MKKSINLDIVQTSLMALIQSVGLTKDEIMAEIDENAQCRWAINYDVSINARFNRDLRSLVDLFELFNKAKLEGDDLAAFCALQRARFHAHTLFNIFEEISSDIDKVLYRDERFKWPKIPDKYEFPDRYGIVDF